MMQLPYYSLPNVLYGDFLVPEVMQNDLTVENLKLACDKTMQQEQSQLLEKFKKIHQSLLPKDDQSAAKAVLNFAERVC